MLRLTPILLVAVLACVTESSGQFIIIPKYMLPQTTPRIIAKREAEQPQWLYKGDDVPRAPSSADHPYLPRYIDPARLDAGWRYASSVDSPSARRGGGGAQRSSGGRDTGPTHPGYNRRNARSISYTSPIKYPPPPPPTFPKPSPFGPRQWGKPMLIARAKRDIQFPQKPKHHDIVLTGWNPNAKVNSWQKIRVKAN